MKGFLSEPLQNLIYVGRISFCFTYVYKEFARMAQKSVFKPGLLKIG